MEQGLFMTARAVYVYMGDVGVADCELLVHMTCGWAEA